MFPRQICEGDIAQNTSTTAMMDLWMNRAAFLGLAVFAVLLYDTVLLSDPNTHPAKSSLPRVAFASKVPTTFSQQPALRVIRPCMNHNGSKFEDTCHQLLPLFANQLLRSKFRDFIHSPPKIYIERVAAFPWHECIDNMRFASPTVNNYSYQYSIKFAAEALIPAYVQRTSWHTTDIESADYILLSACRLAQPHQSGKYIHQLMSHIKSSPLLLRRYQQRPESFIGLFTFDHGPCSRQGAFEYPSEQQLRYLRNVTGNMTRLQNHAHLKSACYNPRQVVSIPTPAQIGLDDVPGRAAVNATRAHLAFFAGVLSHPFRNNIRNLASQPGFYIPRRLAPMSYHQTQANSTFCLAVRGNAEWSPRLDEAFKMGCIPVVLADDYDTPFSRVLNTTSFLFRVKQAEWRTLPAVLNSPTADQLQQYLRNVDAVKMAFRYPGLEEQSNRMNAVVMALFQVWMKHHGDA
eukprot:TRINITY_DN7060_c0_g1_i4.p1 TRINITY_DN7060_c0_g1~~TRINITY_DN7060_c0_g1_i4.p1  ORF type:complete len:461 (+),score=43.14 TRINITY_DN7060_c0_g1_i4:69-1451(+)